MGGSTDTTFKTKPAEYKFEDWRELWETSPETFEYLRKKHIEQVIGKAAEDQQHRLRCFQWKIDMVRERAANPLAATIEISEMMWDSFNELNERFKDLNDVAHGRKPRRASKSEQAADILEFTPA